MQPPKNEPIKPREKPCKQACTQGFDPHPSEDLDSLFETLPERAARSRKRMYDRMVWRLDSLEAIGQ